MTTQRGTTPRRAAKRLTDHHNEKCAGFYCTNGARYFLARVRKGKLECSPDFGDTWHVIDLQAVSFHDYNGRSLWL